MELHVFPNLQQLSKTVADWFVDYVRETLAKQERFTLSLSGGSTPVGLHELLASLPYRDQVEWSRVHIFFGDERFVPLQDDRNNARMALETLLKKVPVPSSQIRIIKTENITPEESARDYEKILRTYFPDAIFGTSANSFDLVFLGMGDDGHTLSLFPGKKEVIHETEKWCTSLWLESQQMYRVTLTHGIVNQSARVAFLIAGSGKNAALREVLEGPYDPEHYPSQIINPAKGTLYFFADAAAAAGLAEKI